MFLFSFVRLYFFFEANNVVLSLCEDEIVITKLKRRIKTAT